MFNEIVTYYASLAGIGALVAVLVNLGKTLGFIPDGWAKRAAALGNLLAFAVVFLLQVLELPVSIPALDESAAFLAQVFTLLVQLASSQAAHTLLKGLPWVGTSYSLQAGQAGE